MPKPPTRKSKKIVEEVFRPSFGWERLSRRITVRQLFWKANARILRGVSAVKIAETGEFKLEELK